MDSEKTINLAIITVHRGSFVDLKKTVKSIDTQLYKPKKHLIICRDVKRSDLRKIKKPYREFIVNKDKSIYDAMNIGIKNTKNYHRLFLNSNDILFSKLSLYKISKFLKLNNVLISATELKYLNLIFTIKSNEFSKKTYMPHSSFITPPLRKLDKIYFNTKYKISADGIWMKDIINATKKVIKLYKPLSIHTLGGISTSPTLKTILYQLQYKKIEGFKELLKYMLNWTLDNKNYYRILYKTKYRVVLK